MRKKTVELDIPTLMWCAKFLEEGAALCKQSSRHETDKGRKRDWTQGAQALDAHAQELCRLAKMMEAKS